MAHHAYLYAGDRAEGIEAGRAYAADALGLTGANHPDVAVFEYGLFSVADARRVAGFANQVPLEGDRKLIAIAAGRIFHEAQNALLKLFEEPTEGTTLVLIVPAEGILLPTLLSRLLPLPGGETGKRIPLAARAFLDAAPAEREKLAAKLVARTKSSNEDEKQAARLEAVSLVSGLMLAAHEARKSAKDTRELDLFLRDLDRFLPILHERSAPLKLILEHLLIVLPARL
jgi:hypothetical protein